MAKFLRVSTVARLMDVSDDTVRRQIASGKLKAIRFGRKFLIPETELSRIQITALGPSGLSVSVLSSEKIAEVGNV